MNKQELIGHVADRAGLNRNEAARAVESLTSFDRRRCREVFERRFTAARMARDYVNVYERLPEKGPADELCPPLCGEIPSRRHSFYEVST